MQRSDFKPGNQVENIISGKMGIVQADGQDPMVLKFAIEGCLHIRTKTYTGKGAGKWQYPTWRITNLKKI